MSDKPLWGPWSPDLVDCPEERNKQLRSLASLVWVFAGQGFVNDLMVELRRAELNVYALDNARRMFDLLPTLAQRHIMASFTAVNHGIDLVAA